MADDTLAAPHVEHRKKQEQDELLERVHCWLDWPLTALGLVMLVLLVVDLLASTGTIHLERHVASAVAKAETGIWIIFLVDFILELIIAPSRITYLKTHWLTVIAVILPAFRAVRVLRLARLLRELSLLRILTTFNRGTRALGTIVRRGAFDYIAILTVIVTLLSASGVYYFEQGLAGANIKTLGDAIWWSSTLVTTINSGLEPASVEGRVIGILVRAFAIAVSGYLTAMIAAYLLGQHSEEQEARARIDSDELALLRQEIARLQELVEERLPAPSPAPEGDD